MSKQISTRMCRRRLTILWFGVGSVLFIGLVLQTEFDRFGTWAEDAWSWFLPSIMPTLLLIVGVLVVDGTSGGAVDKKVDSSLFWVAFSLSAFYLLLVAMVIILQPFTGVALRDSMKVSSLYLGPLQGLVAAFLGAFFVKGERGG